MPDAPPAWLAHTPWLSVAWLSTLGIDLLRGDPGVEAWDDTTWSLYTEARHQHQLLIGLVSHWIGRPTCEASEREASQHLTWELLALLRQLTDLTDSGASALSVEFRVWRDALIVLSQIATMLLAAARQATPPDVDTLGRLSHRAAELHALHAAYPPAGGARIGLPLLEGTALQRGLLLSPHAPVRLVAIRQVGQAEVLPPALGDGADPLQPEAPARRA